MQSTTTVIGTQRTGIVFGILALMAGAAVGFLIASVANNLIILALVVGLCTVLLALKRIEWGLMALVFMTYTRFSDVTVKYYNAPSSAQLFLLLLIVLLLIRWRVYDERPDGWLHVTVLIAAYGIVGAASLLFATDVDRGLVALADYAKDGMIAVVIAVLIKDTATLRRTVWALLAAGIVLGTISVFQHLTGTFTNSYGGFGQAAVQNIIGSTNDYRIAGPIGDPNFYAQILLVLVPLALDRALAEKRFWLRLLAFWALAVCTLSIIFTFSRGGILALAAMIVIRIIMRPPNPLTILLSIMLAVALTPLLPTSYTDRIMTVLDYLPGLGRDVREEVSFRGRSSAQLVGLMMFADHPILGVGKQNFSVLYQQYSQQLGLDTQRWDQAPHNLYLEILAETGLVGLLTFAALLWTMFRGLRQAYTILNEAALPQDADLVAALRIGIVGYLVAAIFLHAAFPRYFWLLFGIALAMPVLARRELARYHQAQEQTRRTHRKRQPTRLDPVLEHLENDE